MKQENMIHWINTRGSRLELKCSVAVHQYDYQWIPSYFFSIFIIIVDVVVVIDHPILFFFLYLAFVVTNPRKCFSRRFHSHRQMFLFVKNQNFIVLSEIILFWPSYNGGQSNAFVCLIILGIFSFVVSLYERIKSIYWSGEPVIFFIYLFICVMASNVMEVFELLGIFFGRCIRRGVLLFNGIVILRE